MKSSQDKILPGTGSCQDQEFARNLFEARSRIIRGSVGPQVKSMPKKEVTAKIKCKIGAEL
jgi:hypothetical protein